jgi:hypothetical protein
MYRCRFTVEGRGQFPVDMLRRDACYPESEQDSGLITLTFDRVPGVAVRIHLERRVMSKSWAPTTGWWETFGWKVLYDWRIERL